MSISIVGSSVTVSAPRIVVGPTVQHRPEGAVSDIAHDLDDSDIPAVRTALIAEIDAAVAAAGPGALRVPGCDAARFALENLRTRAEQAAWDAAEAARKQAAADAKAAEDLADRTARAVRVCAAIEAGEGATNVYFCRANTYDIASAALRFESPALDLVGVAPEVCARLTTAWASARAKAIAGADEARAADEAEVLAEAARLEARNALRAETRADWLRDQATPEQRERAGAGFLPEQEYLDGLQDVFFAPFDATLRYERLTVSDVEHDDGCDDGCDEESGAEFSSETSADATAEEFARLKAIRALAPADAVCVLRRHSARCRGEGCTGSENRMGVRVTITRGGYEFRREFAV